MNNSFEKYEKHISYPNSRNLLVEYFFQITKSLVSNYLKFLNASL